MSLLAVPCLVAKREDSYELEVQETADDGEADARADGQGAPRDEAGEEGCDGGCEGRRDRPDARERERRSGGGRRGRERDRGTRGGLAMAVAAGRSEQLLIGGRWVEAADGGRFDVLDPATGEPVGSMPDAGGA